MQAMVRAQMKIQQMAFMILAVFLFFILVGLFFLMIELRNVKTSASQLNVEEAISSMKTLVYLSELGFYGESMALDEDKLRVLSNQSFGYEDFWPVASIKVYKIYPSFDKVVKCPAQDCNYYEIYSSGQKNVKEYASFISVCKKLSESGYVYDKCEIGKLVVGVKINEE